MIKTYTSSSYGTDANLKAKEISATKSTFKDTIVRKFEQDGHSFELRHYFDSNECFDLVKSASEEYWETKKKHEAFENYKFQDGVAWSLGEMLKTNKFELGYTVLLKDGEFLAAAGLRTYENNSTLSLCRFFGKSSLLPYGNAFILPLHLELSHEHGAARTMITFNDYNKHLLNYYLNVLPNKKDPVSETVYKMISKFKYLGVQSINYVDQMVLLYEF